MSRFKSAVEFIDYVTERFGSKRTSQRNFKQCMASLGNPQVKLKCIHVAGTNGKGSTTNYLRSILQEAGYKVGSFTSPHLVVHNDRIRINDENISDERLLEYANQYVDLWEEYDLSMFEIDTLLSFLYFLDEEVDFAVYEVGMGGRLDATNEIQPLVSVITNIGYDHMSYLGNTLELIAGEKAGIVKEEIALFTTEQSLECLAVFQNICDERNSLLFKVEIPNACFKDEEYHYEYLDYRVRLKTYASYQISNSVLALAVIDYLVKQGLVKASKEDIEKGLAVGSWKGRFELVSEEPKIILDGAHNEAGIQALIDSIHNLEKPIIVVFSALKDKEYHKMLLALQETVSELIITEFDFYRKALLEDLQEGLEVEGIRDYKNAINYAKNRVGNGTIIITGSLYFISDVRAYLLGE